MAFNIVELATSDSEDCAFDQPCRFGHRVEGHAVYCHNDNWDDSPRKCRRSWYTGGEIKDEDCAGFELNQKFNGSLSPTPTVEPLCKKCKGTRLVKTDLTKSETCPLCMGSGSQPGPIALTVFEQDVLEMGTGHGGRQDTAGHPFVVIANDDTEKDSVQKLCDLDLVELRSISFARTVQVFAYLLENTMKGEAVMRANWRASGAWKHDD